MGWSYLLKSSILKDGVSGLEPAFAFMDRFNVFVFKNPRGGACIMI